MNIQLIGPAIAGILGGMTIAAVGMTYRLAVGQGFWTLPNGIGGIVLGPEAGDIRSFGAATLTGVALHMVLSATYGVLTVAIAPVVGISYVLMGILVGIAMWIFNYYGVGRVHAGSHKLAELNPVWMAFLLHALYGGVAGLAAQLIVG